MAPNDRQPRKTQTRRWIILAIVGIVLTCAIVVPIAVTRLNKSDDSTKNTSSGNSTSSGSASAGAVKSNGTALAAKSKWDFSKNKMSGINLGNWLVLERWMDEDWFTSASSLDSWDEWSFTQTIGANASNVLEEHWTNWVTEKDLDMLQSAGITTLRIPTGYWMWIPTIGTEPYVTSGQLDHLERVCQYAYDRGMYVIIDLHGLPGSQNGEQQSGHNTTNPTFYQPLQQARSDQLVKAVVDWIAFTEFWSIIAAVEVANEPRPYTTEQLAMLRAYYERSYDTIQTLGPKAPAMMFADGYVTGDKFAYWWDFAAARQTSPASLVLTDHPYPGYPSQTNANDILAQVCTAAKKYTNFRELIASLCSSRGEVDLACGNLAVPTCITEWSLRTGIQDAAFEKQLYIQQITAWNWYAGSTFWSLRTRNSTVAVLADPVAQYQWSFESLLSRGSIPTPSAGQNVQDFITSLGTPCGEAVPLQPSLIPTGTIAQVAQSSASAANALISSVNNAAQQSAIAFGLAGLQASATITGGEAAAAEATVSQGPGS